MSLSIIQDHHQKALLSLAKSEYQNYQDVRHFAERLSLRAGQVYEVLKHHGFIKQNETTEYRVMNAYFECEGNLKKITEQTGLTVWICAKTIEKCGYSPRWTSYRAYTESCNIGDWAEAEFNRLVPQSLNMNQRYQANHPVFDFVIGEKTIDVKASALRVSRTSLSYNFRYDPKNMPDFFCLFCIPQTSREMKEIKKYHVLLIPSAALPTNKTTFRMTGSKETMAESRIYWDFEVQPCALAAFLDEL